MDTASLYGRVATEEGSCTIQDAPAAENNMSRGQKAVAKSRRILKRRTAKRNRRDGMFLVQVQLHEELSFALSVREMTEKEYDRVLSDMLAEGSL